MKLARCIGLRNLNTALASQLSCACCDVSTRVWWVDRFKLLCNVFNRSKNLQMPNKNLQMHRGRNLHRGKKVTNTPVVSGRVDGVSASQCFNRVRFPVWSNPWLENRSLLHSSVQRSERAAWSLHHIRTGGSLTRRPKSPFAVSRLCNFVNIWLR